MPKLKSLAKAVQSPVLLQGLLQILWLMSWGSSLFWLFFCFSFICHIHLLMIHRNITVRQSLYLWTFLLPFYLSVNADDDIFRYLFEAKAWTQGFDPYLQSPSDLSPWLSGAKQVNHPSWTGIYGPLFIQLIAFLPSFLQTVLGLKVIWAGCHLLCAYLIHSITSKKHLALMFLLCPFFNLESLALGHLDILLAVATLLMVKGSLKPSAWILGLGLSFGIWIKWFALPLLPLFIRKRYIGSLLICAVISIVILLPFADTGFRMFQSLYNFGSLWCNGYPYAFLQQWTGSWTSPLIACYSALLLFVILMVGGNLREQLWQFFRMSLFFAPTLHPWYWIFPLSMALSSGKSATFIVLSAAAAGLHYPEFHLEEYGLWESRLLPTLPLFIFIWFSEWRLKHHLFFQRGEKVHKVSVITPCLNEETNLKELGEFLETQTEHIDRWIIVDANSSDQSVEIGKAHGAKVLCPNIKGRGPQIEHGTSFAQTPWCIVLHADTRPPQNFFSELKRSIAKVPDLDGGAFRMAYRGHTKMGPLMFLNDLKTRLLGVSFGDQSQFFNQHKLNMKGGYPKLPLMEDLELSLIWKGGSVAYIKKSLSLTSPRRWESRGRLENAKLIIKLLLQYLWKRHWNPPVNVTALYQKYYKPKG
jgi:hypothetical protein